MRLTALALGSAVVCSACGSTSQANVGDAGTEASADGAAPAVIGAPCTPDEEKDATFSGFSEKEVSIEQKHPQCPGAVCLVNHFRGRATCPYGQTADGHGPPGASPCTVAGASTPVAGAVAPQCADRRSNATILCSCRCANAAGKTDDGASYCTCPSNLACVQLVEPIGRNDTLSGGYCIPPGTQFDQANACASACDPQTTPCP